MKTFRTGIIALVALTALSLAACKKSGNSPSSTNSQLTFQMKADNSSTNLAATTSTNGLATSSTFTGIAGLTFTSGTANISQFKFEAKRNGVEIEVTSKKLTNIDLFAASPSIAGVTIDTGTYREIEIRAIFQKSADTTAIPLQLKGNFTASGGTVIPIEFDLNDNATIKSEVEDVHVTSTTDFAALIHIHLRKLESGVTAADLEAAKLTNGILVISNTSNTAIYNKILNNFTNCGEAEFHGHHHDGSDDNDNSGKGHDGNDDNGNDGSGHN
jgi:hypothetical protein